MAGDPDRKAKGLSVGHLPKSSVITPGGKVTIRDQPARHQV